MVAQGDILHHEYDVRRGDEAVAQVSKHRFAMSDTYGIEVARGEDEGLVLAVAVELPAAHGRPLRVGRRVGEQVAVVGVVAGAVPSLALSGREC